MLRRQRIQQIYDWVADSYDKHIEEVGLRQPLEAEIECISRHVTSPGKFLDIGCGTGKNLALLSRKSMELEVFAMDLSPRMITRTRASIASSHCVIGSFLQVPFRRGKFSYVAATNHTAGHVDRVEDFCVFLKEVKAVLTREGLLFLSMWNLYSMFVWKDATTIAELKKSGREFVITESTMRVRTKDLKMLLLFPTADFVVRQLNAYCFEIVEVCSFSFQRGNYRNKMDLEADAFLFIARN